MKNFIKISTIITVLGFFLNSAHADPKKIGYLWKWNIVVHCSKVNYKSVLLFLVNNFVSSEPLIWFLFVCLIGIISVGLLLFILFKKKQKTIKFCF